MKRRTILNNSEYILIILQKKTHPVNRMCVLNWRCYYDDNIALSSLKMDWYILIIGSET